ncbi:MAG: transposase [Bacteroidales bacterium]|nr:transposase [Bacteroidales bacterium]
MTDKEIHNHCRKYLPHFENQRYQMITYRLYDSVPRGVIEQWKREVDVGVQAARLPNNADATIGMQAARLPNIAGEPPAPQSQSASLANAGEPPALQMPTTLQQKQRQMLVLIDKYEDTGYGQCFMKNDNVAQIIRDNLMFHNGKKYNLLKWCIMPNHVHTLIEVFSGISLSEILHCWRSYTAHQINKLLNRTGQVWMMEYFDRYIRDSYHFEKVVNYIHNNPVKAGLVKSPSEYRWSSAYDGGGVQAASLP